MLVGCLDSRDVQGRLLYYCSGKATDLFDGVCHEYACPISGR